MDDIYTMLDGVYNYTGDPELKRLVLLEKARLAADERKRARSFWARFACWLHQFPYPY